MTNVLAGNPAALGARAESYLRSAAVILEAAEELSGLVIDQESKSTDAVGRASKKLAKNLRVAHRRYVGTARALKTYSVDLSRIQQNYREAQEEAGAGASAGGQAAYEIDRLTRTYQAWESQNVPASLLNDLADQVRYWQGRERSAGAAREYAQGVMNAAENDLEEAARRAIDAIENAIDQGADSRWSRVKKLAGDVYGTFVDIGKWAAKSIAKTVKGIARAVGRVFKALAPFVAMSLLMMVAALERSPAGIVATRSLAIVTAALPAGWRVRLAFAVTSWKSPAAAAVVTRRIISDVSAPDPRVYEIPKELGDADEGMPKVYSDEGDEGLSRLRDREKEKKAHELIRDARQVDYAGRGDSTVIDIKKVVKDGVTRWVVTLPSTKDWVFKGGDLPAANDMDSNLALLLAPNQRTQYERAVLDAMKRAGIRSGPHGDPVMLVGFSQGGIMAGHLASNRSDLYNFKAALTAGSPIDGMKIPSSTRVVSVQHVLDPVHRADLTGGRREKHWTSIGGGSEYTGMAAHNADNYAATLEAADKKAGGKITSAFSEFLGGTQTRRQFVFKEAV